MYRNGTRSITNSTPVKRLTLVARLPPAFYIVPHTGWNYGIVKPFYNSKLGGRLKLKMLTNLTCMHTLEKTNVGILIHAHFAVSTVLSNKVIVIYLVITFFSSQIS